MEAIERFALLRGLRAVLDAAGVTLASEEASREVTDALVAQYAGRWRMGTLWTDTFWESCKEAVRGLVLVASGPEARLARGGVGQTLVLAHPERPGELLVAPSTLFPAALFLRVPAAAAELQEALASLDPAASRPRTAVTRAFMGHSWEFSIPSPYSTDPVPAGPRELDRHFNFSPAATP